MVKQHSNNNSYSKVARQNPRPRPPAKVILVAVSVGLLVRQGLHSRVENNTSVVESSTVPTTWSKQENIDTSKLHPECFTIPNIRPSGVFFADSKDQVKNYPSISGVEPAFRVGSVFPNGNLHMGGDKAHFQLIREHIEQHYNIHDELSSPNKQFMALDIGANQGFYTFFLAALGLQTHAFEIDPTNVLCVQQGTLYNTKDIADRVFLYPMGLSETVGRMGSRGKDYEGFLVKNGEGPILSSTLDCFAHHIQMFQQLPRLDTTTTKEHAATIHDNDGHKLLLPFVKIDVEGFEIAVLKGAHNSLYHPSISIGSLLVEVGPSRWNRASISLEEGVVEMKLLASQFVNAFLVLRTPSVSHFKTCPTSFSEILAHKQPEREVHGVQLHRVEQSEWDAILTAMATSNYDCNFWYTN